MERTLDIFKNDAFSQASLRKILPLVPYVPGELERMNLTGTPHRIDTEVVLIYYEAGHIRLIPMTDRGAPFPKAERNTGKFVPLKTPRIRKGDNVRASEMLGIADMAYPLQQRLVSAAQLVTDRMLQLRKDAEATIELHNLGMVQGKIVDADGVSVKYNFYELFEIAEPVAIGVDWDGVNAERDLAAQITQDFYMPIYRSLQARQGGVPTVGRIRLMALCGDNFWWAIMKSKPVQEIWKRAQEGRQIAMAMNPLATPPLWEEIEFGGVTWRHYLGAVSGPLAIPVNDAIVFPVGAQDVFDEYWSPGESLRDVQGLGQEWYPNIRVDPRDNPEFIEIDLATYRLKAAIYPQVLQRATLA